MPSTPRSPDVANDYEAWSTERRRAERCDCRECYDDAGSSKGRTADFESANLGSSPSPAVNVAIRYEADSRGNIFVEYDNGKILPTGCRVARLASESITVEEFERLKIEQLRKPTERELREGRTVAERLGLLNAD